MIIEEKEIKLDLDNEENYKRLIGHFKNITTVIQINTFFDTAENDLMNSGWALRIREIEGQFFITAKGMNRKGSLKLAIRPEIQEEIGKQKATVMLAEGFTKNDLPAQILEELNDIIMHDKFMKLVTFNTKRTTIAYETNSYSVQLEIDKTEYADHTVDYELEIEIPVADIQDKVIEQVRALLERLNIPFIFQKYSKFGRALKKNGSE
ncbi:MAG: CYTH domain-containing protein [Candidatus Zixiibacteriota bacterium]